MKDYAIFMLDTRGNVINWNRGAQAVFGYEEEEIINRSFNLFYLQQDIQNDDPRRNLALAERYGQYETEGLRTRKNGQSFWAHIVFTALKNDAGQFSGYSTIVRDISEKKKIEEELTFLSRQIDHSNDAIYVVDAGRRIKSWNRGAENLYGFTAKEVLDKDANDVLKTDLAEAEIRAALKKVDEQGYWVGELKRRTKTGKEVYVHSSTSAIRDNSGDITGYVAVSFDISDQVTLRGQVNYLASLVEQSQEAIISTDTDGHIISWNAGAEKMIGYKREEVQGKKLMELGLGRRAADDFSVILNKAMATGGWKAELDLLQKNGSPLFGAVNASIIKNKEGGTTAIVFMIDDISIRKQLEEKLQRSNEELEQRVKERTEELSRNEQRFRALIENSAEGITLTGKDGSVFYRSPGAYKITGNLSSESIAENATHPDDVEIIKAAGKEAMARPGMPVSWQVRFKHASGEYEWMEGTLTNLFHVDGVNAIVANYRNINSRKLAEEKLIANEVRFRSLIENITDGIVLNDEHYKILYQSPSVKRILGYTEEERAGKRVTDFIHPDYVEHFIDLYKKLENSPGKPILFQYLFRHKNGHYIWLEGVVTNLLHDPSVNAYVANYRDITERKHSEELLHKSEKLYRSLFENMLNGFAYCKGSFEGNRLVDYTFVSVNNAFEEQTGLKDIEGKKISEIAPEILVANQEYIDTIARVALEGSSAKFETFTPPLKKWLAVSLYSPEKEYFVVLVDNITDRKQHEQKIKKLNADLELRVIKRTEELKKTNDELEAFSYSVSHDLRAPLRAIIGFTAMLEDDYGHQLDGEAKRITSIIKSNTLKMGHLIDDLLSFSRMGRQDMIKTNIDTDEMVRAIIDLPEIKQENGGRPVKWVLHDLPNINGDANTLRQVWINLISNAVKYSGKSEHPEVEINFRQEDEKIIFSVRDNGVGFDERYKNKLFRVFQRLHSPDEFEGTGIGLAIVEKIISKHDGAVWAESAPGKGASFYFSLPGHNEKANGPVHFFNNNNNML
jgi:PAS domain S-box-containing protein